jgi:hypothetical protein
MKLPTLLVVAAGPLLGPYSLGTLGAPPPDAPPYFAKVDIQGVFYVGNYVAAGRLGEQMYIRIRADSGEVSLYPVDVSKVRGLTYEKLAKVRGRIVRITGTLEFQEIWVRRDVKEKRLVIVAQTLVMVEKLPER